MYLQSTAEWIITMENIFEKEDLKLKKNKDENFQQIAKFGPKTSILSDHGNLVFF